MSRRPPASHGTGEWHPHDLGSFGSGVVVEAGVLMFHPASIHLGDRTYVGHRSMLKGYHKNEMRIGQDCWIGQDCFLHSAGGIRIGDRVGIGPGVKIITSQHEEVGTATPILWSPLSFSPIAIEDDCDIGVGSIILPGVVLGRGSQVGAGAVVTKSFPAFSVIAGIPAKLLRVRSSVADAPAEPR